MDKELIDRINVLANKKKTEGLSEEELAEQKQLRERYIKEFREGAKEQLLSLKIVDKEGTDVTPEKLKKAKAEREEK